MVGATSVVVKTSVYEGPLDLLLELVEKRKLLINDIALAAVTDEYIARLNTLPQQPIGEMAQFISLAATLLLIKSRSLLPLLSLSEEENRDIKELQYRLALYQILKETARELAVQTQALFLYEGEPPELEVIFLPDETVTPSSLYGAARALIDGFSQIPALPKVEVRKVLSLEEAIEQLSKRVSRALRMSFSEFAQSNTSRYDIIVSFLALLELIKQGIIRATQKDKGEIILEPDAISTPSYE